MNNKFFQKNLMVVIMKPVRPQTIFMQSCKSCKVQKKAKSYQIIWYDIICDLQRCINLWAIMQGQLFSCNRKSSAGIPRGTHLQQCSNTFVVSHFINYFHTAPCTRMHRIQRLFHNTEARVIVKQSGSIFYQVLYISSSKKESSPGS